MRTRILVLAALSAVAGLTQREGAARPLTTEATEEVDVNVTLRDSGITVSPNAGERGTVGRFIVHNLGRKPHNFVVGKQNVVAVRTGLATPVMQPRSRVRILLIFLDYRGELVYRSTIKGDLKNPRMRGIFTIR